MGCCMSQDERMRLRSKLAKKLGFSHLAIQAQGTQAYIKTRNQKLKYEVQETEDFLSHHLRNQQTLTNYSSSRKIRARQILQHTLLANIIRIASNRSSSPSKIVEFSLKAWFQRTFIEALDRAQKGFLEDGRSYDSIRQQLTEEYIFQIYQLGSFLQAGMGKFSSKEQHLDLPLSIVLLQSDSALYPLLQQLQERYPLVAENIGLAFPQVSNLKSNINLLDLINSKSYTDIEHLNIQTTMDDLKFLIDKANEAYPDFKQDMETILGGAQTDCKVKWKSKGQSNEALYVASAVRRVFIKWIQTLIQRIPDVYELKQFVNFVHSKKIMADEFIFKGNVSPTTHHQVVQHLTQLLESLKCKLGTKVPREQFGLFLYDLLRSKTTRKTPQQVVQLLETLKQIKKAPSGKRFEVVRIKNRFKLPTRDLLVNFRYGEHLIAEVQLCVDTSHESPEISKKIKLRHFLYELQRGLFGPTFELIMQYQDFSRKDIVVNMQAEGLIASRRLDKDATNGVMKRANRLCPQKHEMIAIAGNNYAKQKLSFMVEARKDKGLCDFCFEPFSLSEQFHYCYYCSIFFCRKCEKTYSKADKQRLKLTCLNQQVIKQIDTPEALAHLCSYLKSIIVVFYREGAISSQLLLDLMTLEYLSYQSQSIAPPPIYKLNVGKKEMTGIVEHFKIERTPSVIVMNSKQQSMVTLVGCTFQDAESLIEIRDRLAKGFPKGLQIKCLICNQPMSPAISPKEDEKCQICLNTNKIEGLKDLVRFIKSSKTDFVCAQGHVRCHFCSYLNSNEPSYFRDFTGKSYLSDKLINDTMNCSKGHKMEIISVSTSSFECNKCKQVITRRTNEQAAVCGKCNQYLCIDCKQTEKVSFEANKLQEMMNHMEIVSHFAQNRLEEGYPCGCGKLFQRAYQSLRINEKGFKLIQLLKKGSINWTCWVCKKEESKLKLHLACFYCDYAKQITGQVSHVEICIQCAIKSGILGRVPHLKAVRQLTNIRCSSEHPVILSSLRQHDALSYPCSYCKLTFYPYTQRYQCQQCQIKICLQCGNQHLQDEKTYATTQVCKSDHALVLINSSPRMQFCRMCGAYLQGKHFECPQKECRYLICMNCGVGEQTIEQNK